MFSHKLILRFEGTLESIQTGRAIFFSRIFVRVSSFQNS